MERRLRTLPSKFYVYFGVLKVQEDISDREHQKIRSRFLTAIKEFDSKHSSTTRIRAVAEVADDCRIHYHYAMFSDMRVPHHQVKKMWSDACRDRQTVVDHDPPRKGIVASTRYMFKDVKNAWNRTLFIRLFEYGTPRITWQSRDFFTFDGANKEQFWSDCREEWYGGDHGKDQPVISQEWPRNHLPSEVRAPIQQASAACKGGWCPSITMFSCKMYRGPPISDQFTLVLGGDCRSTVIWRYASAGRSCAQSLTGSFRSHNSLTPQQSLAGHWQPLSTTS